eukprot:RCo022442
MREKLHAALQQPSRVVGAVVLFAAIALGLICTNFQPDRRPWEESFVVSSGAVAQREWARLASLTVDSSGTIINGPPPDDRHKLTLLFRVPSQVPTLFTPEYLRLMLSLERQIVEIPSYRDYCWRVNRATVDGCFAADTCIVLSPAGLVDCMIRNATRNSADLSTANQAQVDAAVQILRSPQFVANWSWSEKLWGLTNQTVRSFMLHRELGMPAHPLERTEDQELYANFLHETVEPVLKAFQAEKPNSLDLLYWGKGLYAQAQSEMLHKDTLWMVIPLAALLVIGLRVHTHSTVATIAGVLTLICDVLLGIFAIRIAGLSIFNTLLVYLVFVVGFLGPLHILIVADHWRASIAVHGHLPFTRGDRLKYALDHAYEPVAHSAAVAALGFGTKLFSELPPEQVAGLLAACLCALSGLLSLTFFPSVCALMDRWSAKEAPSKLDISARLLFRWNKHAFLRRAPVLFMFTVISALSFIGMGILSRSNETRANVLPYSNELEVAQRWGDSQFVYPANPVKVWLIWGLVVNSASLPSTWNGKRQPKAQYVSNFNDSFGQVEQARYLEACSWTTFDLMRRRLTLEAEVCVLESIAEYQLRHNSTPPPLLKDLSLAAQQTALWHFNSGSRLFEMEFQTSMHFDSNGELMAIALPIRTYLPESYTNYETTATIYQDYERLVEDLRDSSDALGLMQTSPQWVHLMTQQALVHSFLLFTLAAGLSVVLYLVLCLNFRLALVLAIALVGEVMINVVAMLLYGWSCGIIENQAIQCAVPFCAVCCVVFIAAYRSGGETHRDRKSRTQDAMRSVTAPVVCATLVVLGASLPAVILGNLPYTRKFCAYLITNMVLNIVMVLCVMPALGFTIAPEGREGELYSKRRTVLTQVPGVSFFFLAASGSKWGNAVTYCLVQIVDQVKCVLPIATYLMVFSAAVFQMGLAHMGFVIGGLVLVVVGLFFFLEGLKFGLMPMGNTLGQYLPFKVRAWAMQLVAFLLGVLVTFAEPAIGALQAIGRLVTIEQAPYLYLVLNVWDLALVLCVGAGVGIACTLGLVRFTRGWRLRPMIFWSLWPPVLIAVIMHFAFPLLRPTIGLAWDCGAVTTGPVTVPLVLALGLGVSQANKRAKKEAAARAAAGEAPGEPPTEPAAAGGDKHTEMFQDLVMPTKRGKLDRILRIAIKRKGGSKPRGQPEPTTTTTASASAAGSDPNATSAVVTATQAEAEDGERANLDGFGVVTLASLYPILTVEALCCMIAMVKSADSIIHQYNGLSAEEKAWYSKSPVSEVVLALRAVVPLVGFLVFVLKVVLKVPLPYISLMPITGEPDAEEPAQEPVSAGAVEEAGAGGGLE